MVGAGSWNRRTLGAIERQDYDGVVYLNRYEGVPLEAFDRARQRGIGDVGGVMVWKSVLRAVREIARAERKAGERMN
jgi:hypothetical protein